MSTSRQMASVAHDLYATAASAALSSAAPPSECNQFRRMTMGPLRGCRRDRLFRGAPLVQQDSIASQGRLVFPFLGASTSLSSS